MRIIIVGPGRAGLSLGLAAAAAGHSLAAVVGRDAIQAEAAGIRLDTVALTPSQALPEADLAVLAVRDAAIAPVAGAIADQAEQVGAAVHMSGLTSVAALDSLRARGLAVGSLHPLQTMPSPEGGAAQLEGAWFAVTAAEPLRSKLRDFARSLGGHPFDLADEARALYHAAASAAANFPIAALTMAADLFDTAGVPFAAAEPLVSAAIANAFEMGPRPALTGPVSRGDVATVQAQLEAIAEQAPAWLRPYSVLVLQLARIAGRQDVFEDLLASWWPAGTARNESADAEDE